MKQLSVSSNFYTEISKSAFTAADLRFLISIAIEGNGTLELVKEICQLEQGKFLIDPLSQLRNRNFIKRKVISLANDSEFRQAIRYKKREIFDYLLESHLDKFSDNQLGSALTGFLQGKKIDEAKKLLAQRPNVSKSWSGATTDEYPQHLVANFPVVDLDLFKSLCTGAAPCDLKQTNKDGDTAVKIAINNKHTDIVKFIVSDCSDKITPKDLKAAEDYLKSVAEPSMQLRKRSP